jgi:adenylate cyclase, class 2
MREIELKSVVDDLAGCRRALERRGATLVFEGRLEDRRYDTADGALRGRDEVLRVRTYRGGDGARTSVDWKGPRVVEAGYKVRQEISIAADPAESVVEILSNLGYSVVTAIDRWIVQYTLDGAVIRFERYPRMDDLVEVEGDPTSIERAIGALGIARRSFTADGLTDFVERFEERTGQRAAVCEADLDG